MWGKRWCWFFGVTLDNGMRGPIQNGRSHACCDGWGRGGKPLCHEVEEGVGLAVQIGCLRFGEE